MTTNDAIRLVWDYHHLRHTLTDSDAIWVLCSHDLRVANRAVELWKEGLAPFVIMSGGFGNFTEGVFERPEAELFAERAVQLGLPESKVLVEPRSTNCGENVVFTRALLAAAPRSCFSINLSELYFQETTSGVSIAFGFILPQLPR